MADVPLSNSIALGVQTLTTKDARGTVIEEHWVIHQFFSADEEEVINHFRMLRKMRVTGKLTINIQQGGIGMVEYRERGATISR